MSIQITTNINNNNPKTYSTPKYNLNFYYNNTQGNINYDSHFFKDKICSKTNKNFFNQKKYFNEYNRKSLSPKYNFSGINSKSKINEKESRQNKKMKNDKIHTNLYKSTRFKSYNRINFNKNKDHKYNYNINSNKVIRTQESTTNSF